MIHGFSRLPFPPVTRSFPRSTMVAGRTPIRRWEAAVKGIEATRDRPKRPVDYGALCARVCASLGTIFKAWPELTGATKGAIEDALRQCLDQAPWNAAE